VCHDHAQYSRDHANTLGTFAAASMLYCDWSAQVGVIALVWLAIQGSTRRGHSVASLAGCLVNSLSAIQLLIYIDGTCMCVCWRQSVAAINSPKPCANPESGCCLDPEYNPDSGGSGDLRVCQFQFQNPAGNLNSEITSEILWPCCVWDLYMYRVVACCFRIILYSTHITYVCGVQC